MTRVLLFGVDGLAFRILNPMIERGLLPNFQRVRDEGAQGILASTVPPMTPPSWMSISTGVSLSKHGVYDFWEYEQTAEGPRAHVLTHRKGSKAIWNILSEWGKRVVVANVPMTYPPEPVNGMMLSGYMAPDMRADVTYPGEFKQELLDAVPEYMIDLNPAVSGGQVGDPFAETLKMTQERIAMFRLLLSKTWDFCFVAFVGADRIQHLRWEKILEFHPQAVAYYQMLDEALGMALAELKSDDVLMIVSDHGFQGAKRTFYIQEYLYKRGLLRVRDGGRRNQALFINSIKRFVQSLGLKKLARKTMRYLRRSGVVAVEEEYHAVKLPDLDWQRTQAWVPSSSGSMAGYADIFLAESLSVESICDLMRDLRAVRDPQTGQLLVQELYREEVYGEGAHQPGERHLVVLASESCNLATDLGRQSLWETNAAATGIHHPDGVLYLYGANVKHGVSLAPSQVYDVVPTILSRMGLPLPPELDGQVINEAFEQPSTAESPGEGLVLKKLKKLATSGTTGKGDY
ncbi:MAG TPA: alkaline phosphatase family protein [Ktedonobacteraceae bacterium]|nr:alkaline phosphatase family protein [Ktedonobacteraceae bacterium]